MLRFIAATLLFVIMSFDHSRACTCYGPPDFCESVLGNEPELVALAVKTADQGHGMSIDILEVLHGTESRSQVIVWGDNGFLCRYYTSYWNIGDTVVFALHLIGGQGGLQQEDSADYYISACGRYFLDFSAGQVSGNINGTDTIMPYTAFKNSLASCTATSIEPKNFFGSLVLAPNPARDFVQVTLPAAIIQDVEIRVLDLTGRVLSHSRSVPLVSGSAQLQTAALPLGAFILYVTSEHYRVAQKLVITGKL